MSLTIRQAQRLSGFFRILGDPTRLRIVRALLDGERNVSGLCRTLRISQPTVSRHLSILKMSRLAEARRSGKEIFYSLPPQNRRTIRSMIQKVETLVKK